MSRPSSMSRRLTMRPVGPVCGVTSFIPRMWPAMSAASSAERASFTPPALPRPPAWICALTTQIWDFKRCAASRAFSKEEAREAAQRLKSQICVVKAQIHAGGRGKAGGVKLARSADEAADIAGHILGMKLVTPQTGPTGRIVKRLLIEEGLDIKRELYLGLLVDRATGRVVFMASAAGGMEIEEVAKKDPAAILRETIHPSVGLQPYQARKIAFGLSLPIEVTAQATPFLQALYRAFLDTDASLLEINPCVLTGEGRLVALDAKMTFDDNGLFRHTDLRGLRDLDEEDPLEVEASKYGLNYIKLDGNVGCMVNGAGLAMATMDIVKLAGGEPANFLDV